MPPPAKEVKHHPASVNDLLLRQLLERTPDTAVLKGLTAHLSALSTAVAGKVLGTFAEVLAPHIPALDGLVRLGYP